MYIIIEKRKSSEVMFSFSFLGFFSIISSLVLHSLLLQRSHLIEGDVGMNRWCSTSWESSIRFSIEPTILFWDPWLALCLTFAWAGAAWKYLLHQLLQSSTRSPLFSRSFLYTFFPSIIAQFGSWWCLDPGSNDLVLLWPLEVKRICAPSFHDLWLGFWGSCPKSSLNFRSYGRLSSSY